MNYYVTNRDSGTKFSFLMHFVLQINCNPDHLIDLNNLKLQHHGK